MRSRSKPTLMPVQLEPSTHIYTVGGGAVDSVSELLREAGFISVSHYTLAGRDRGSRVHAATEAVDRNEVPLPLPVAEQGYLESYLRWRTFVAPMWEHIESPRYSATERFAGTPDRIGTMGIPPGPVVVDLKTGAPQAWHRLQLALYDLLYASEDVPPMTRRRVCVYLRSDGRCAQSVTFHDRRDYSIIRQLLDARVAAPREGPDAG